MVALDVDELVQAESIVNELSSLGVTFKIGNQLGTYEGWAKAVQFAHTYGALLFADTKFKDIPITVEKSARAITRHQPDFFNVMADTSKVVLESAVRGVDRAIEEYSLKKRPIILGVTVLTSFSDEECISIYGDTSDHKVVQFAEYAAMAGLDGVVCSAHEAKILRASPTTSDLLLVTPGIRPLWASSGDQSRITTPKQAIENGADYIVIGRPITEPPTSIGSSKDAVQKIIKELQE